MFDVIVVILLAIFSAALLSLNFYYADQRYHHMVRLVAVAGTALVIGLLADTAVATERLMFGTAGAVFLSESYHMVRGGLPAGRISRWARLLPVIMPLLFVYPYLAYLGLFFGFDVAIFFYAAIVVLAYLVLRKSNRPKISLCTNAALVIASVILLVWLAVVKASGIV